MKNLTLTLILVFTFANIQAQKDIWILQKTEEFDVIDDQKVAITSSLEHDEWGNVLSSRFNIKTPEGFINFEFTCNEYYDNNALKSKTTKRWLPDEQKWSDIRRKEEYNIDGKILYAYYLTENPETLAFTKKSQIFSVYDLHNNLIERTSFRGTTLLPGWNEDYQVRYKFNAVNFLTEKTTQFWDSISKQLENNDRRTTTYNSKKLVVGGATELWDKNTNSWTNFSFYTFDYLYDQNGYAKEREFKNTVQGAVTMNSKRIYTNDSEGNILTRIQQNRSTLDDVWENKNKYLFTYENGLQVSEINQKFDESLNEFVNLLETTHAYDNGKEVEKAHYTWLSDNSWFRFELEETNYNDNGQVIRETESYQSPDGDYERFRSTIYSYDEINHLVATVKSSSANNTTYSIDSTHFEWVKLENRLEQNNNNEVLSFYPNPTSSYFRIKFNVDLTDAVVKIYLPTGQLIQTEPLACARQHDVSHLKMGLYFVQIEANEGIFGQQLVIMK